MKLYNPTHVKLEGSANGTPYFFEPFKEEDVWMDEHAIILLKTLRTKGLVTLAYTPSMQKKYKTFELFRKAQQVAGLTELVKTEREAWVNERQAERDVKEHAGCESDKDIINPKKFLDRVEEAEKLLQSAIGSSPKKEKAKEMDVEKELFGASQDSDGFVGDSHKSPA